jgi:hypothetical protein
MSPWMPSGEIRVRAMGVTEAPILHSVTLSDEFFKMKAIFHIIVSELPANLGRIVDSPVLLPCTHGVDVVQPAW